MTELRIVQVAYAVNDVHRAAEDYAARYGMGPFLIMEHIKMKRFEHAGREAMFDHSFACGQWGSIMAELIHVHASTPDSLASVVDTSQPGVHHVASFVDDLRAEIARQHSLGHELIMEGVSANDTHFGFVDARHSLGHLIELYEPTERLLGFYHRIAALAA